VTLVIVNVNSSSYFLLKKTCFFNSFSITIQILKKITVITVKQDMLRVSSLMWWKKTVHTFFYENSISGQRQITEYNQISRF